MLSPRVLDYIDGDDSIWEKAPLERITADGQLTAYEHTDFWRAMDMLRDKMFLEDLWATGEAPWKVW